MTNEGTNILASGGSLLSALLASACCWLPLSLVLFGVSAGGLSAVFDRFRPLFLLAAVLFLSVGFYLNYFRKERCESGVECEKQNPGLKRFGRAVLWIAVAGTLAFGLFPNYAGALFGGGQAAVAADRGDRSRMVLRVDGMTCAGCATAVRNSLVGVVGVIDVMVSVSESQALVTVDPKHPPAMQSLIDAVNKTTGYRASAWDDDAGATAASATGRDDEGIFITGHWRGAVQTPDGEIVLVVDIARTDAGQWIAEFDAKDHGMENYPAEIDRRGRTLTLRVSGIELVGEISEDGSTYAGRFLMGSDEFTFELERRGAPEITEERIEFEAASEDLPTLHALSSDGGELKKLFNDQEQAVRLVTLLSPS